MTRALVTQMLEALEPVSAYGLPGTKDVQQAKLQEAAKAAREYLATEPIREREFYHHEVEKANDWSEWVCPHPEKYLMKCCDCGLVHEMQFRVVKYSVGNKCQFVNDPNTQAVFRARRVDAQPADKGPWHAGMTKQDARVYVQSDDFKHDVRLYVTGDFATKDENYLYACTLARLLNAAADMLEADAQQAKQVPLSDDQISEISSRLEQQGDTLRQFARAIEAHHDISSKGEKP